MSIKYRIKFTKGEEVKYIGHLDIMRLFQRAINRADLPIEYSKGFNPHQQLSFAHPLSLGYTSDGEYGDFEMKEEVSEEDLKNKLNEVLPYGVLVKETVKLWEKAENAMASVDGAEYEAVLSENVSPEMIQNFLSDYLEQKEIVILKKTKNSEKEADIKPDIFDIKDISDKEAKLYLFIAAGSRRNVRADLVVESFYNFINADFDKFKIRFKRIDLYRKEGDTLVKLGERV